MAENRPDPAHVRRVVVSRRNRVSLWLFHSSLGYQQQDGLSVALEMATNPARIHSRMTPDPEVRVIQITVRDE
jgi:hypothetical protein